MKLRPEHFDWLGFGAFIYILIYALYILMTKAMPPVWATDVLFFIAAAGAIVDGIIVYRFFLKRKN